MNGPTAVRRRLLMAFDRDDWAIAHGTQPLRIERRPATADLAA